MAGGCLYPAIFGIGTAQKSAGLYPASEMWWRANLVTMPNIRTNELDDGETPLANRFAILAVLGCQTWGAGDCFFRRDLIACRAGMTMGALKQQFVVLDRLL
ncbi:hypothetical protein [Paraburkholderia susongensis]|uniref:Uncharacterized protein n=1 Tax=Paraburkholderia susongensis TaxID=1515439 RepID=A0A1X7M6R5_9BURK|nr:hypothetical protein [Paraburkholderia susongensis]SMG61203.1 hypothetical protein SAMN06265784_12024 [Paraburkholderia susongensis]